MADKPTIPDFPTLPDFGKMITQACEVVASVRGIPYDFNGTLSLENKFVVLFKTVNEMFDAQDALVKSYKELYDFINNYFANLDVQEEINNKLDELVNSGRLDTMLSIFIPYVTLEMFGGIGDGVTDDTQALKKAIENSYETGRSVIVTEKNFLITETIDIIKSVNIMSISNKKYNNNKGDVNYNLIFNGSGYLFNIHNNVPFNNFCNLYIKGNGENRCFYVASHRNSFEKMYINNFNTCFLVTQDGNVDAFENKISNNFFESNDTVLMSTYTKSAATDGYFTDNIIIQGTYSLQCDVLSQWIIARNHDYSTRGMSIAQAVNLNIVNNYFDNTNNTSLYLLLNGICNITGNQFLCNGTADNCYKIRLTTQSGYEFSSACVTCNTMTQTKGATGNWYLLWSSVPVSFSGNNSFQEYNLLYPISYNLVTPPYNAISKLNNVLTSTHNITNCVVIGIMDKLKLLHLDITLTSNVDAFTEIIHLNNLLDIGINQTLKPSNNNDVELVITNASTAIVAKTALTSGIHLTGDFTIIG